MISPHRAAATGLLVAACAFGAGCGSSSDNGPKVSSDQFVSTCQQKGKASPTFSSLSSAQLTQLCKCVQQQLVAKGDGDKHYSDPALKDDSNAAGRTCAQRVNRGY